MSIPLQTFREEQLLISTADGIRIPLWLYLPERPRAMVQFNPGTAAKMRFYQPFLRFFAERGYVVGQLGYRGCAEGPKTDLANCGYGYSDYGLFDIPAGKNYLQEQFPDLPFFILGHSGGGQQLPFTEKLDKVIGAQFFGVSTGFARPMPLSYKLQSHFFFYLFGPVSLAVKGYIAASKFKIMEDLPPNVFRDWKAWCGSPDYFFDEKFYGKTVPLVDFERVKFPIHHYHSSDEVISTPENVRTFWRHWKSSGGISHELIRPEDYGQRQISHFGYFRRKMKPTLWQEVVDRFEGWL